MLLRLINCRFIIIIIIIIIINHPATARIAIDEERQLQRKVVNTVQ